MQTRGPKTVALLPMILISHLSEIECHQGVVYSIQHYVIKFVSDL